ncbi:DMT family transporter [Caulobacter sp. 17J65-9]|uniref:DMT family transporter n=1 Tax=Caulobacter sp. 17J65-9 TaxID=2709382 RepID=UPI0013C83BED|nr:DMT family transporter [Caulobacter sp. 17J65-9]NEX92170.1 DMT family transporter [Caulobacter sp. 17J65-9]
MVKSERGAAVLALVLGAAAIGFAPILVRLTETGPAAAGFWRLFLAVPLLAIMTFSKREPEGGGTPWKLCLLAGVLFAGDLACWHYGVTLTSVTNATVLTNLMPVVVTVAAWLMFKEKPARLFVVALGLALIGAWMMAAAKGAGGQGTNPALGNLLSIITAAWYGAYFLVVRAARMSASASRVMFWSTLAGTPVLLIVSLAMGEQVTPLGLAGWAACVGLAVVHVTGQGAIAWALGRLPAATASVVVFVQPVVAAILGWIIFAERIVPMQALGGLLALSGVVLAQWSSARSSARAAAQTKTGAEA